MGTKTRFLYVGKFLNTNNDVRHRYIEVTDQNILGEHWTFKNKLFRKGAIGSIYMVNVEGTTAKFSKTEIPTSYIQVNNTLVSTFIHFKRLYKDEELTRQIDIQIRNSKKPVNEIVLEINRIKELYDSLPNSKKQLFVADLVYRLTK